MIETKCAKTKEETIDTEEKATIGIRYISESYSTKMKELKQKSQESELDSKSKENWLYVMVTTTEKMKEKGKGTPQKTALNAIAAYFEKTNKSNLVYKVGFSKKGNLLKRIKKHNKTYGSKFICAFHIPCELVEKLIHCIFY